MNINIGIAENNLQAVALELNRVLADEYIVYTKTRSYHWNVEGSNFMEMHKFYESQYEELDEIIDEVAERVRALGHYAEGRLKDFTRLSRLEEPESTTKQSEQLRNLLNDDETIIQNMRKLITTFAEENKDLGTSDFITSVMEKHEKMAWFIRSYLK
ncbi:MAG TPA: DNA starvation/stationary phase protection protein [Chryseosolibacter sp.]